MTQPKQRIIYVSFWRESSPHGLAAAIWLARHGWPIHVITNRSLPTHEIATPLLSLPAEGVTGTSWISVHVGFFASLVRKRLFGSDKNIFYIQGSPACLAAFFALIGVPRRRIVYESLDFLEPGRFKFWEFFESRVARRAGCVINNESGRSRFFVSHYGIKAPAFVVETALLREWPVPQRGSQSRMALFGEVGLSSDTGVRLVAAGGAFSSVRMSKCLLEAFCLLPSKYILVFSGAAPGSREREDTERACRASGVRERCVILGFLKFEQLLQLYADCDVGVLLYPNDGIGNFFQSPGRLTEYARCGLPFVTSNFPSLELKTVKYDLGVACDPYNPHDIARAIMEIGERPDADMRSWSGRIRDTAKSLLAYEQQADRIEKAVVRAMGNSHA